MIMKALEHIYIISVNVGGIHATFEEFSGLVVALVSAVTLSLEDARAIVALQQLKALSLCHGC